MSRPTHRDGVETFEANILVNAVGAFTNPKYPDFEGIESFEGQIVHPARWPADFDLHRQAHRRSSATARPGVQMLAPIAEAAEQVYVFQRTPQWISPRPKYGEPVEPEIRWLLDNFPGYWNWWRYMAIAALFQTHRFLVADEEWRAQGGNLNPMNDKMRDDLTPTSRRRRMGARTSSTSSIPDYAPFSRRPVVDNGWYRALTRDNVELVTDGDRPLHPQGHRDRRRHGARGRRRSSPPPASRS